MLSDKTKQLIEVHQDLVEKNIENWIKLELKMQSSLPKEVLSYFNEVRKTYFPTVIGISLTPERSKQIKARIRDDKSLGLPQFKGVIDFMFKKWIGTEYEQYLQWETLFSNKFHKYLDMARQDAAKKLKNANKPYA